MSANAIPELDLDEAQAMLEAGEACFVDVRDPRAYAAGHIPGATSLNDNNVGEFCEETDKTQPVVVYCYHGHSSRGATGYLLEQGFESVYSLQGGFEAWRVEHPTEP